MDKHKRSRPGNATDGEARGIREAHDDPHRLAQVYVRGRGLESLSGWSLKFWRQQWWVWDGRRYRLLSESDLRSELTQAIKREFDRWATRGAQTTETTDDFAVAKVTTSLVSNVLQALRGRVLISGDTERPAWVGKSHDGGQVIAVSNGLLDLHGLMGGMTHGVLRPHSPDWFSPVCLNYPFQPDAKCDGFLRFVDELCEGDSERIALVQEWFGYCLTPDTSLQKMLIVPGDGGTGKKVLVDVLTALLGADNVTHVPLELFGERFQLTATLDKLANIATEIGEIDRAAEGILKAYVAGDRMYFDRKNLAGVQACPTARLMFTTNTLPSFRDRSNGIWRRLLVLPCRVVVPVERQDPRLPETLKLELSGIFNWATEGLRRLRARGRFIEPAVCREALEEYRTDSAPVRAFLGDQVVADPAGLIECTRLYRFYKAWAEDRGHTPPLNDRQFGKEVARMFPRALRKRGSEIADVRPWIYLGIQLRDQSQGQKAAIAALG